MAPSADWLAQQLRQLTPFGQGPKFLLCDHDAKFGAVFDEVAKSAGVRVIRTPVMAPRENAHCERLIGPVRRECLDRVLVLGERPDTFDRHARAPRRVAPRHVISRPVLGGLHHDDRTAA